MGQRPDILVKPVTSWLVRLVTLLSFLFVFGRFLFPCY
ncbi:MAG: DUF2633 family protein [Ardenticatenales bacterium]|nr:DUF2633 family protein [Ardenticatenales bacterium]